MSQLFTPELMEYFVSYIKTLWFPFENVISGKYCEKQLFFCALANSSFRGKWSFIGVLIHAEPFHKV